jgi:mono/diheme cytochrome c family protein
MSCFSNIVMKSKSLLPFFLFLSLCALSVQGSRAAESGFTPAETEEFFETHVRPVLAQNCYGCHGPGQQMGGLRLDTKAGAFKGGQDGPVLAPGDPEKSALVKAVRYIGAIKMPPSGKLKDDAIKALAAWVKLGAPWPDAPKGAKPGDKVAAPPPDPNGPYRLREDQKKFWSFQPVHQPALPKVKNEAWVKTPVDRFILAKLEAKRMKPAPPADKRTLLRRATFDLIGLPPTPEEVAAFLADKSPNAFAKVVDRLLASPHYGERWGRHWLDVARYADTKGYTFNEDTRYPYSYIYRDYVTRAFNEDLPYDQFVTQQLAADHLPLKDDKRPLAAMGFLTLGRRFLNNPPDINDDRIDVTTRGLMGLSVSCARCHNHKFDPIPTQDYYSLYSIFASSEEPAPISISPPSVTGPYEAHQAKIREVKSETRGLLEKQKDRLMRGFRTSLGKDLLADAALRRHPDANLDEVAKRHGITPLALRKWRDYMNGDPPQVVFGPWKELSALPENEFARKAPDILARWSAVTDPTRLNPLVAQALKAQPPQTLTELADRYGELFNEAENQWQALVASHNKAVEEAQKAGKPAPEMPSVLPDASAEGIRSILYGLGSPLQFSDDELEPYFDADVAAQIKRLRQQIDDLVKTTPPSPEFAMTLQDAATPTTVHVFKRGNPGNPGEEAPRRFLLILAGEKRKEFTQGSGRLELAQAIVSKSTPLTARVMVNRIWLHHFGAGIVRTPSDFGVRGERPTHPELLDYLAWRFMNDGWSIKKMHRLIMLSSAYQEGYQANPRYATLDPENRLLWSANRRRLEVEPLRDSMLAVSGQLDPTVGGPAVEITQPPYPHRRTLYGFIDRQNLQSFYRTFDLASPDTSNPQRFHTMVPQQALFMMNSPFVVEQAKALAHRPDVLSHADPADRIRALYRVLFGRSPAPDELALGLNYLNSPVAQGQGAERSASPWQYGYGGYDETTHRTESFTPLPFWTGQAWQGGKDLPDPKLRWVLLTASGGHPGKDAAHAVIRRWTAPRDAVLTITGTLGHESDQGDGVRAWIVSSRRGELGHWDAHHRQAQTSLTQVEVKRGDTLDFIVECRASDGYDAFTWAPVLKAQSPLLKTAAAKAETGPTEWSAEAEFSGPPAPVASPLTPWEKYAQVLMETNEFAFVD